jgi:hypothetical protein
VHVVRDDFVLERVSANSDVRERFTLYQPDLFSVDVSLGVAYQF